jgi:hypothetical protein
MYSFPVFCTEGAVFGRFAMQMDITASDMSIYVLPSAFSPQKWSKNGKATIEGSQTSRWWLKVKKGRIIDHRKVTGSRKYRGPRASRLPNDMLAQLEDVCIS